MQLTVDQLAQEISSVEEAVVDLTWRGALFEVPAFRTLFENPSDHYEASRHYLASPEFSEQKKTIVAISSLGHSLPTYLELCNFTLGLLESNKVSYGVFESIAFPTFDLDTKIVENYERQEVRRFLNRALASKAVGDRRKEIIRQEILTGRSRAYVLDFRGNQ